MASTLTPSSPLATALQASIGQRLQSEGFAEDETPFVSEFIIVMICNNKSAGQIQGELDELLGPDKFPPGFTAWLFSELARLANPQDAAAAQQENAGGPGVLAAPSGGGDDDDDGAMVTDADGGEVNIPTRPAAFDRPLQNRLFNLQPGRRGGGPDLHRARGQYGVGKGQPSQRQGPYQQQPSAFMRQNAMNGRGNGRAHRFAGPEGFSIRGFSGRGNGGYRDDDDPFSTNAIDVTAGLDRPVRERCRHWPNHTQQPCKFAHPTEICENYPNCPNARGTCPKIHVGEDMSEEDAVRYVQSNGEYEFTPLYPMGRQKRVDRQQQQDFGGNPHYNNHAGHANGNFQSLQTAYGQRPQGTWGKERNGATMPLCKFGLNCTNRTCEFAHPTPANSAALVLSSELCAEGISCIDENCDKAHPSPASMAVADPAAAPPSVPAPANPALEQCKYYPYCSNRYCKFRHPEVPVNCRNGAACTNRYCKYIHPLPTPCLYDTKCTNPDCLFQHPNGRAALPAKGTNVWVAPQLKRDHVSDRKFAVEDDQTVERMVLAAPGEN